MKPVQIAENVYDVGVTDWNIRDFHGYSTYRGTTYNAFLILDDKITLIDTVKSDHTDQLLDHISRIVDPEKIDVVISNHTEMDHSGGIPRIMHRIGEDKPIYCSKMGYKNLAKHFHQRKFNYCPVEDGATLQLGSRSLTFMETRMLHWPDSMFTYLREDEILFSSDAFGQHYAGYEEFDDEVGEVIMPHAKKYFANILLPYAPLIAKLIEKVKQTGLRLRMICPDHGILWRKDPGKILEAYAAWGLQESRNKAVLVYDSMWHSTEMMAEAVAEGIAEQGGAVHLMRLRKCHRSDVVTEILDAKAVVVGSPTLNNGIFPTLADFLCYLKGLKPKQKIGAAFGSYGWSGEAAGLIQDALEQMKFEMVTPALKVQYVPGKAELEACREFGRSIGRSMNR
jgi:flavorubredoxin